MRKVIIPFIILFALNGRGQSQFFEPSDTLREGRMIGASAFIGATWTGSLIGLHQIWYADNWGGEFQFFDDSKQWMQMDKVGHFYAGQLLAQKTSELYQWSGVSPSKSRIIGSAISFGYLTSFEALDGHAKNWGFSWSDVGANALGSGWYLWQDLLWQEQRFQLTFSTHLSRYAQYRPGVLGNSTASRLLKDYNGQTYWLSINPSRFLNKSRRFPKWLNFAIGYSVDEKLHGVKNNFSITDAGGTALNFNAYRQYLFSLDIDLTQINVKSDFLKTIFSLFNHIKIPFPALEVSKNGIRGYPIYF